ncbi:hypothetical protein GOP47_0019248 [Adiantum capillus-veneris]|uniref:Uncharacterized protein n=1 Tax=Adiantum capillus-veneris TaxID=13818 RepID=A0A9D4Z9G6_ADICA|nr:hypothetical protein GOP47_0019248 [Adiantum capillus-veneris]
MALFKYVSAPSISSSTTTSATTLATARLNSCRPLSSSNKLSSAHAVIAARAQHSDHRLQEDIHLHRDHVAISTPSTEEEFVSARAHPLAYNWDTHKTLDLHPNHIQVATPHYHAADQNVAPAEEAELSAPADLMLTAELRLLANAVSDRAEMHSILAQQRDNWNKLFQRTLTSTALTACLLSALAASAQYNAVLSVPALLLNAGTAAMMAVINHFQPSQLAEEQRTAARLFLKLASDIHYALHLSPLLRQSPSSFLTDCKRRLRALDKAFPMPLTPGGLEKFPAKVVPPALMIEPALLMQSDDSATRHQNPLHSLHAVSDGLDHCINGWTRQLTHDLKDVATMLRRSDIPKYTGWAQNLVRVNKSLAIAAPFFAALAALLNGAVVFMSTTHNYAVLGMWAATCSVLSTFASSFSHDTQLGMVFELYRNSAGYYADVETTIKETFRMPVEQRENGSLFRQRIAYQLGRWPTSQADPIVPADAKEVGTLF